MNVHFWGFPFVRTKNLKDVKEWGNFHGSFESITNLIISPLLNLTKGLDTLTETSVLLNSGTLFAPSEVVIEILAKCITASLKLTLHLLIVLFFISYLHCICAKT